MLEFYLAGAALTAAYLWCLNRPHEAGGYAAYCAFIVGWPLLFAFALFHAVRRG